MNIGSKYIHADSIGEIKGKPAWAIVNTKSDNELAAIAWYLSWKRYCMFTDSSPAVFDVGCMESIVSFIKGLAPSTGEDK